VKAGEPPFAGVALRPLISEPKCRSVGVCRWLRPSEARRQEEDRKQGESAQGAQVVSQLLLIFNQYE
jgi:hypothetical protein